MWRMRVCVFDRVRTYHQKITARVRRVISAGSARAEAARGLNARRKAHHRSRAFERNATRCRVPLKIDSRKLGLMLFEIALQEHTQNLGGLSGMRGLLQNDVDISVRYVRLV